MKMAPDVVTAKPLPNFMVEVVFDNGEKGVFDVKPHLNRGGVFQKLKEESYFNGVKAYFGVVSWYDEVDIDPDTVYAEPKRVVIGN